MVKVEETFGHPETVVDPLDEVLVNAFLDLADNELLLFLKVSKKLGQDVQEEVEVDCRLLGEFAGVEHV